MCKQLLVEEVRELRAAAVRAPGPTIPREPVLTCERAERLCAELCSSERGA